MSGNGIRCLVQAAVDAGLVPAGTVAVWTLGGVRSVEYRAEPAPGLGYGQGGHGPRRRSARTSAATRPPVRAGAQRVDIGNPHVVLFGAPAGDDMVRIVGPRLERSRRRRGQRGVRVAGPGPGDALLRVWERGVGETLACGTGTCAAAAAAHAHGAAGTRVEVHNPGGVLEVEIGESEITLAGPTQKVGDVTVDTTVLARLVRGREGRAADEPEPVAGGASGGLPTEVATRQ